MERFPFASRSGSNSTYAWHLPGCNKVIPSSQQKSFELKCSLSRRPLQQRPWGYGSKVWQPCIWEKPVSFVALFGRGADFSSKLLHLLGVSNSHSTQWCFWTHSCCFLGGGTKSNRINSKITALRLPAKPHPLILCYKPVVSVMVWFWACGAFVFIVLGNI